MKYFLRIFLSVKTRGFSVHILAPFLAIDIVVCRSVYFFYLSEQSDNFFRCLSCVLCSQSLSSKGFCLPSKCPLVDSTIQTKDLFYMYVAEKTIHLHFYKQVHTASNSQRIIAKYGSKARQNR